MYDRRLESIDNELNRLSEGCINTDVLVQQLRSLTMSQNQYTIDNMIILYTHVYNHVHFLNDPSEIYFKRTFLNQCLRGIDMLHELDHDPTLNQDLFPKYLRDMALSIVSKLKDALS